MKFLSIVVLLATIAVGLASAGLKDNIKDFVKERTEYRFSHGDSAPPRVSFN